LQYINYIDKMGSKLTIVHGEYDENIYCICKKNKATYRCMVDIACNSFIDFDEKLELFYIKYPFLRNYYYEYGYNSNKYYCKFIACDTCMKDEHMHVFTHHPNGFTEYEKSINSYEFAKL
jgi:hypothetical protein